MGFRRWCACRKTFALATGARIDIIPKVFSWFKKRSQASPEPREVEVAPSGNPSRGRRFTMAVTGPAGDRTEEVDLVKLLMEVFQAVGRDCATNEHRLI